MPGKTAHVARQAESQAFTEFAVPFSKILVDTSAGHLPQVCQQCVSTVVTPPWRRFQEELSAPDPKSSCVKLKRFGRVGLIEVEVRDNVTD